MGPPVRHEVTLFQESRARIAVEAPPAATDAELYGLALEALDAGEGHWEPVFAGYRRGWPGERDLFWDTTRGVIAAGDLRAREEGGRP